MVNLYNIHNITGKPGYIYGFENHVGIMPYHLIMYIDLYTMFDIKAYEKSHISVKRSFLIAKKF